MSAIQHARLKIQSAQLAEHHANPLVFVRRLHALLEIYAERTRRPGQSGVTPPLLMAYRVPQPVLRQIVKELSSYVVSDPQAALALVDALWEQSCLEFRLLAANLLGQLPPEPPDLILERISRWATPSTEDRLLNALLRDGMSRIRRENCEQYLAQVRAWLSSEENLHQLLGLRALLPILEGQNFENLPVLMRILAPLVWAAPARLRPELLEVLHSLIQRSPKETAYFLRQNLAIISGNPGTTWLIRTSLRYFPLELQASLREALREEI